MISTILCFALSAVVSGSGPFSFDSPRLLAECSWLGNSSPGAAVWVQQDIRECLRAHRRSNGEYVIFLEDDFRAKVLMYRWKPADNGR